MILTFLDKHRHIGLLILRIGIGCMFLSHGLPKLFGGPEKWAGLGEAMATFGITFLPAFWGFMAAISESLGGLCFIFGIFFRPACALLTITMLVAAASDLKEEGFMDASHAIEAGIVFLSFILIGPGKYSLDEKLTPDRGDDT